MQELIKVLEIRMKMKIQNREALTREYGYDQLARKQKREDAFTAKESFSFSGKKSRNKN
jgi:hypothetical protein